MTKNLRPGLEEDEVLTRSPAPEPIRWWIIALCFVIPPLAAVIAGLVFHIS